MGKRHPSENRDVYASPLHAKYITQYEAADLLRVGRETIHTYYYKGLIGKYKVKGSNRTLYLREEIVGLLRPASGPLPVTNTRTPANPNLAEFLTAQEVADFLRMGLGTVHKWGYEGRLTKYKMQGSTKVLYRRVEIEALIEELPRIPPGNYPNPSDGPRRRYRPDAAPTQSQDTIRDALKRYDEDKRKGIF